MTQTDLRPGLYRAGDKGPVLTGGKCARCGFVSFPRASTCLECGSEENEQIDIGSEGKLFCETTVHMKTDHFAPGYSVCYVTMPNGVRVFGQLRKPESSTVCIGDLMKVEVARMWEEGDNEVLCYRFTPQGAEA